MSEEHLVLVVDDDPEIRASLSELLGEEGYQVVAAANGREALDWLRAAPATPCMILLDLMMPEMTGWEFRDLQSRDPQLSDIPVTVISACGETGGLALAADRVLCKPLRIERLLDLLDRFC